MKNFGSYAFFLIVVSFSLTAYIEQVGVASGQSSNGPSNSETLPEAYPSSEHGVGITFPEGWNRLHISNNGTIIEVATLSNVDERAISELLGSPSIFMIISQQKATVDSPSTFGKSIECGTIFKNYRLLKDIPAIESTVHCKTQDKSVSIKSIMINTGTRWVVLMYSSPSVRFDDNIAKFEAAVGTLMVRDPNLWHLTVDGKQVPLLINSSSIITDLGIDAQNKRIFITTEGGIRSNILTVVSIGRILEGPYTVTLDDQTMSNFRVIQDGLGNGTSLEIMHPSGVHTIDIACTNVIPEFPTSAIVLVAASSAALFAARIVKFLDAQLRFGR